MSEIKKEIKDLMDQRGETLEDIAKVLEIPPLKAFYELSNNCNKMEVAHVIDLADHFGVDIGEII